MLATAGKQATEMTQTTALMPTTADMQKQFSRKVSKN
jgi:hypothetical protein